MLSSLHNACICADVTAKSSAAQVGNATWQQAMASSQKNRTRDFRRVKEERGPLGANFGRSIAALATRRSRWRECQ